MSILDTFDDKSEEILKPEFISPKAFGFPEVVIATFKRKIAELATEIYGNTVASSVDAGYMIPINTFEFKGRSVAVYFQPPSSSSCATILEEMISKGGKKFIYFGTCGALDRSISPGQIIIPTAAYRDEGVSYHYMPAGDFVELPTANRLAEILDGLNTPYLLGKTWTTDALYRETRTNMAKRKDGGCIAVDMECASVAAVGRFRGVEVYYFLYAEDNLDTEGWDPRTIGKLPRSADETFLKLALEIAASV